MTLLVRTDPASRTTGACRCPGREAARDRRRALSRAGHERRRDRGDRLSRHEGIRVAFDRLRSGGRPTSWRTSGPGLVQLMCDLESGPHPDRRPRHRRAHRTRWTWPSTMRWRAASSGSRSRASPLATSSPWMAPSCSARGASLVAARPRTRAAAATWRPAWPSTAARIAWAAAGQRGADPRRHRLCGRAADQRIWPTRASSHFRGAGEIQAQVITRRCWRGPTNPTTVIPVSRTKTGTHRLKVRPMEARPHVAVGLGTLVLGPGQPLARLPG